MFTGIPMSSGVKRRVAGLLVHPLFFGVPLFWGRWGTKSRRNEGTKRHEGDRDEVKDDNEAEDEDLRGELDAGDAFEGHVFGGVLFAFDEGGEAQQGGLPHCPG